MQEKANTKYPKALHLPGRCCSWSAYFNCIFITFRVSAHWKNTKTNLSSQILRKFASPGKTFLIIWRIHAKPEQWVFAPNTWIWKFTWRTDTWLMKRSLVKLVVQQQTICKFVKAGKKLNAEQRRLKKAPKWQILKGKLMCYVARHHSKPRHYSLSRLIQEFVFFSLLVHRNSSPRQT